LGSPRSFKAWVIDATINLASPAIIISPPIAQLPRTGFYATTGGSVFGKIGNFLFHSARAMPCYAAAGLKLQRKAARRHPRRDQG
jgi:hypothetical protein